jgi:hypothetical protein
MAFFQMSLIRNGMPMNIASATSSVKIISTWKISFLLEMIKFSLVLSLKHFRFSPEICCRFFTRMSQKDAGVKTIYLIGAHFRDNSDYLLTYY